MAEEVWEIKLYAIRYFWLTKKNPGLQLKMILQRCKSSKCNFLKINKKTTTKWTCTTCKTCFLRSLSLFTKGKVNPKLNMLGQLILDIHSAVNMMGFISLLLLVNYISASIECSSFLQQIIWCSTASSFQGRISFSQFCLSLRWILQHHFHQLCLTKNSLYHM